MEQQPYEPLPDGDAAEGGLQAVIVQQPPVVPPTTTAALPVLGGRFAAVQPAGPGPSSAAAAAAAAAAMGARRATPPGAAGGGSSAAGGTAAPAAAAGPAATAAAAAAAADRRTRSVGGQSGARALAAAQKTARQFGMTPAQATAGAAGAGGKVVQLRQKDKLVLLPRSASEAGLAEEAAMRAAAANAAAAAAAYDAAAAAAASGAAPLGGEGEPLLLPPPPPPPPDSLFVDLAFAEPPPPDSRGRVTVYCIAEALKMTELEQLLQAQLPPGAAIAAHAEVLHAALPPDAATGEPADAFFFSYGVACFWGLSVKHEQALLARFARKAQEGPLPPREVEVDHFEYHYSAAAPPAMQNDTITLSRHHARDAQVKLAICHALAQSTKLCIHEERVVELVLETKHLPQALAQHGTVSVSSEEVARRIGQVFLQRSAVNLLSSILDTPDYFWGAPDQLQVLYERACDYLELDTRVEVLNARFTVLSEMLDMLRDHVNNYHSVRLEWIIIWLIAVELLVGVFELMGLFGIVGSE